MPSFNPGYRGVREGCLKTILNRCPEFRQFLDTLQNGLKVTLIRWIQGRIAGVLMNIQFLFQGTSGSPWMNEYMKGRLERLEKYLPRNAEIQIELVTGSLHHLTNLSIRTSRQHYRFAGKGSDLYESFTSVLEEALKVLRLDHQKIMNRKSFTRFESIDQ